MKSPIRIARTVAVLILCSRVAAAQAEDEDGPITARAFDAVFVKSKLENQQVVAKIRELPNGARLLAFVQTPADFLSPATAVPTVRELEVMRKIAAGVSVEPLVPGPGGSLSDVVATSSMSRESAMIYGITDFVIARMRTELAASTIRQARKWFATGSMLESLFPSTAELIRTDTLADGTDQILLLRIATRRDFNVFPAGLWRYSKASCVSDSVCVRSADRGSAIDALLTAGALSESFIRRESPLQAFSALQTLDDSAFMTRAGRLGTRSAYITAGEIARGDSERFVEALQDTALTDYVTALLAHELLDSTDVDIAARLRPRLELFARLAESMDEVRQPELGFQLQRNSPAHRQGYLALAQTFASLVEDAAELGAGIDSGGADQSFVRVLRLTAGMSTAIVAEDYVTAIALGLAATRAAQVESSPHFLRWATFAGALGSAHKPEDVAVVLEQFALPPASYLAKRYPSSAASVGRRSIHINSYLGVSAGVEWLNEVDDRKETRATYGGLSLPIGVEFTVGRGRASFFFPVLDLGAVASYRFGDSKAEASPNITLANVVAPGAYVTASLHRDFPLAVGIGWQYAPRLRNLSSGEKKDASRLGVFLSTDIPLFRIR